MRKAWYCFVLLLSLLVAADVAAQRITYSDPWSEAGFKVRSQTEKSVGVDFSIHELSLEEVLVDGQAMTNIALPGSFLFNGEGAPNLPGNGRYIAIPQGATPVLRVTATRTETVQNVNIVPAPRIQKEDETGPMEYNKDPQVWSKNSFYPSQPVTLGSPMTIRGVDVVMLGITPFQYNPVTRELKIYRDLKVEVSFVGGNGQFGEERLRSRFWDPILEDVLLNYSSLPSVDYDARMQEVTDIPGFEYLIITPNGAAFTQWADSIRRFRIKQGISTVVKTLAEVGGNTPVAIENYINTAYNTWNPAPAAILLLGDYGTDASNSVVAPMYNNYCVSDNIYGDVNNDHLPDITMARITAQNAGQLQVMVSKFLNYERTPPTAPGFYQHPVTAMGWQTQRWYQICAEATGGFWKYAQGKDPVRVNEIYSGTPGSVWSTMTNTAAVVDYFGPNGQNYIPAQPSQMACCWTGGNAEGINNAINAGAFCVLHRDHGNELGWGEPSYSTANIGGLHNVNNQLPFIFSINCLTGKYNYSSESFAEKFHRYSYNGQNAGALGVIAASEVSYSLVNDTYLWGMMDNFWPDFMPTYGTNPVSRGFMPCFGNAAGKYFLQQSNWPYNTGDKIVTYHLFHYHGDAFGVVYSEVPQPLAVAHASTIQAGSVTFQVTANNGAFIALTSGTQILGTATGTGSPQNITIPGSLVAGQTMTVTVTRQNFFRYSTEVSVVLPGSPVANFNALPTVICAGQSVDFSDLTTGNPTSWSWSFPGGTPSASSQKNPQNVVYPAPGTYSVTLTVANSVASNSLTRTAYITVSDPSAAPMVPDGDTTLCQNNANTIYTITPVAGALGYTWELNPSSAGTLNACDTACIVNWEPGWTGNATIRVKAVNGCGPGPYSLQLPIHVNPLAGVPDMPTGPGFVCQELEISTHFYTESVPSASMYTWDLTPTNAGTITWSDTMATVTWSNGFAGIAEVRVKASNQCSESDWSAPLDVIVNPYPVAVPDHSGTTAVTLYPNPNNGQFRIALSSGTEKSFSLTIVNTLGSVVYRMPETPFDRDYSAGIDVAGISPGIYYVIVATATENVTRKMLVR